MKKLTHSSVAFRTTSGSVLSMLLLFFTVATNAQTIRDQVQRDTMTYVYKLNNAQLKYIFEKDGLKDTTWFFTNKVDSFHYNKFDQSKLADGCYLKTQVVGHKLSVTYFANYPFDLRTKSIKDNHLVYLFDKKNKKEITSAKITVNDRKSAYDNGFGGYALNIFADNKLSKKKLQKKNKYIRVQYKDVDYYYYLNGKSNYVPKPSKSKGVESSISPGYFIVSQPKFRHYDTVKYKAYLINPFNGKPLRKKAQIRLTGNGRTYWSKKIKRKSMGAYYGQFVLSDSLKIDKDYRLQISYIQRGRRFYNNESFRLEDYQLDKNNYQLIVPRDTFNAGEAMELFAKATDANGFALGDTRLKVKMSIQQIIKTYQDTIIFKKGERENWYSLDTIMDELEPTKITIPKHKLLNGLIKYKVVIDMIDVRQEKKQFVRYVYWDAKKEKTIFTQIKDTIVARHLFELKDTAKRFDLLVYQNSKLVDSTRIKTPYKKQVKYNYTLAVLRDVENEKTQTVSIKQNLLNLIDLSTKRTHDSVTIKLSFPLDIPLHYKIYKNKEVVASGTSRNLNYAVRDNSKDDYFLLIASNLNGELEKNYHYFKISQDEKELHIKTNLPKEIYPGDKVPLEITVTDYKKQAKENINITSYAISSMFKDAIGDPNIVSPIAKVAKLKIIPIAKTRAEYATRSLSLSQNYTLKSWMVQEFNLHKNDFYKIYYPLQNTYTHYLPLPERNKSIDLINKKKTVQVKSPTQFSVLPVLGQRIVRPSYVRMNKELVYNATAHTNLPYSTPTNPGTYTVEFRFQDHLIRVKNVVVKPNQKTLLCVSMDSILENNNRNFIVADSLPSFAMTTSEFQELDKNALFVNGLYFDTLKVYPLNDEENAFYYFGSNQLGHVMVRDEKFKVIALPPHTPNQKKFALEYGNKTKILNNDDYKCAFFFDNKITIKEYDTATAPLFPSSRNEVYYNQLLDHINSVHPPVIKNAEIKKVETAFFEPGKTIKKKYVSPVGYYQPTNKNNEYIQFEINNTKQPWIVGFWIVSKENPKNSSYFRPSSNRKQLHHHYGGPGKYDIYLLFDNKEYIVYKDYKLASRDFWYINTQYLKTQAIEKSSLIEPILQYNRLTQKPLQPFTNYPDEGNVKANIINSNDRSNAQIKGILQHVTGGKIGYKEIYLERNGRFVLGATTNDKGEFEFLNVPKGSYMLKIFGDKLQPRYAYNVDIKQNAVYTYSIEMKNKNYLRPDLQINENEVRLQIFQSKENTRIQTFGNVYDLDTRAAMSGVTVSYLSKGGNVLAKFKSSNAGRFEIYTQAILEKSFDIKLESPGYRDIILRDVVFLKTNANQLSVFMRTLSNKSNLPLIIKMGLEKKTVKINATKPKASSYKKTNDFKQYAGSDWGGIDGKLLNEKGEPIPFALIVALNGGIQKGYSKTDLNGNYKIKPLKPGTYNLVASSVGYSKIEIQGVEVRAGRIVTQNISIAKMSGKLKKVVISAKKRSFTGKDRPSNSNTMYKEEITKMASVNPIDAIGTIAGVNKGYSLSVGGDRSDGTLYFVDGIQMRGSAAIQNLAPSMIRTVGVAGNYGYSSGAVQEKRKFNLFKSAKAKSLRTNFSNLGYWVPNLVTDKNGKAYATLNFPDDVTMWKSYIVAMGRNYFNGVQTNNIKSYKPVMVNSIVPRFLHASDKLVAKAKFVNFDKDNHNVQVKISVDDKQQLSKTINLEKNYVDSVTLAPTSTDSLIWKAELDMDTYYKDGEELKIPVFRDGLETTKYELHTMDNDTTQTYTLGENTKTTIYFNNTVLENILVEINKLKDYPYSCNEQKASKVKGLLLEQKIRAQLKQPFEHKRMAKKLINQLERSQKANGSWGWWSNGSNNNRMTIYITEVLHQANKESYNTSSALLARDYIRKNLKNFNQSDKLYALYLLKKMNTSNVNYDKLTVDIDYYDLNACDRLYYISNQYTYKNKLSKSQVYDCLSLIRAQSSRRYYDNFFYDPSANMALAIKLLDETSMKNNVTQSVGKLVSSGKFISSANTFSKVYLIEAWLKSIQDKPESVVASIKINDTLTVDKFPYKYATTASKIKINHTGAPVWSSMVQDIYLPDPAKKDSLFNVRTQFKVGNEVISKLTKGKDVNLNVKVMSYRTNKNIMLVVPIPSACTYKNKAIPRGNISHIEYYKNKVIYYIENLTPGDLNLSIPLRVNFSGNFTLPPAEMSLMYYPYKSGNNSKGRISVK